MMNEDKIRRIDRALEALSGLESDCTLCPRRCRVDRRKEATGICQTGAQARVSHALLHFGEEPVLSGHADDSRAGGTGTRPSRGSGTIFFSGCNLKCLFCQNYQLSWLNEGNPASDLELASMMLDLQGQGALNINLVSPTHVILPILKALRVAYARGLSIPLVYNSNGYDRPAVVGLLDGIIDVYLPDIKYFSPVISKKYSGAADYFENSGPAVREMSVQQPVLELDGEGAARKGLIIRHLVMPGFVEDSLSVLRWIKINISPFIGLSLMSQYHPCYKAPEEIRRPLAGEEYREVTNLALELGFENLFIQPEPFTPGDLLVPDFNKKDPFRWK
jgi:putative pyruvate formate lyase activating enzyme